MSCGAARSKSICTSSGPRGREPWLTAEIGRAVHRCIQGEAQKLGCEVLALGGMPDHVHLVVKAPATVSAAALAKQVKGATARMVGELLAPEAGLGWQEGYGVFSISRSHVERVKRYVLNQETHHSTGRTWTDWEEIDVAAGAEAASSRDGDSARPQNILP